MNAADLRPDCARCAALCCVAFAFEPSADFAVEKPAETPCPNLDGQGRCGIYAKRASCGFGGCIAYDCQGAGQRVVQDLFGGRSWLEDRALLGPMLKAFEIVRGVHRQLALLETAGRLELPAARRAELDGFERRLQALAEAAMERGALADLKALTREIEAYLPGLAPYLTARTA